MSLEHISGPIKRLQKKKFKLQEWLPKEEDEQIAVINWARARESRYPALRLLHASMNGILTDAAFGAKCKRLGRKAGVPDLFLPVLSYGHHGLWIELKRRKGGKISNDQEEWHKALRQEGFTVIVANGFEEAKQAICNYLGIAE
jgi:hypothetical protein